MTNSDISFKTDALKFGIGIIICFCLLNVVMFFWGEYLLKLLLPFYSLAIDIISTELEVESISLGMQGSTKQILVVVKNPQQLNFGATSMPAGIPMQLSTLQGHALQHLIIIYSIILAWPPMFSKNKLMLLLTSVPFLLMVELIDIPFVLLGSGYDLIYSNLAPHLATSAPSIMFMDFLNGGGRLALSIAAAICTIASYQFFHTKSYNQLLLLMFSNAKPTKL